MLLYMVLCQISKLFCVVYSFLLVVGHYGQLNGFVYCYILDSRVPDGKYNGNMYPFQFKMRCTQQKQHLFGQCLQNEQKIENVIQGCLVGFVL